ncbi:MAG: hypothetical protein KAI16_00730 [Candidatus Pacebacteria bacterium]|nr:hypothetical protein [Candidatus Paceibacterota bacterium]
MLVWIFITLFYFNDLKKGFNSQRKVSIVIEDELGLFSNKLNLNSEDKKTIYPLSWKNFEEGNFFRNSYLLMGLGFVILMLTIIFIK